MITITKYHAEFETFKNLVAANDKKKESNTNICNIVYCHNDKLICTDGFRLHIINKTDDFINDTKYNIITNTAKEIIFNEAKEQKSYPDYNCILPDYSMYTIVDDITHIISKDTPNTSTVLHKISKTGNCINYKYLECLNVMDIEVWTCKEPNKPVVIKNEDITIIIMAIIIK